MSLVRIPGVYSGTGTDDPLLLLRNEHLALLAQLRVLEQVRISDAASASVLRALLRDGTVHFRREAILLRALGSKLGTGGQSLRALVLEHYQMKRQARELLRECSPQGRGSIKRRRHPHLRSRIRSFTKQFQAHIQHEEMVVFVLAGTRLGSKERKRIACDMLAL